MSKQAMSLGVVFTKFSKVLGLAGVIAPAVLLAGSAAWGGEGSQSGREAGSDRAIRLITVAPIPPTTANNTAKAMYSFDISWVDQATQTYYLADRSNLVVDVVDAKTGTFTKQLPASPPFRGFLPCAVPAGANDCAGPNGVVTAEAPHPWLFVTDAGSRVVTINVKTGKTVADVVTKSGEPTRADELAYSPELGLLLVINNAASPPFGTLIKVDKATGGLTPSKKNIIFDALHLVDARNGVEQPVWDPDTGRFYLSIPQVGPDVRVGGVARINPMSESVETVFPVNLCSPAGLALGPHQDLFIGCNMVFDTAGNPWSATGTVPADPRDVIIDAKTGKKTADVFGVGAGDEVWFNKGDGNYYATGSGSPMRPLPFPMPPAAGVGAQGATPLGVVDSKDERVLQLVTTFNVPAGPGHPAGTAHSVAANANNNLVFVPLGANNVFLSPDASKNCLTGCVAVFGHPDEDGK